MNDLTDYHPAVRALMADPERRKEAVGILFCKGDETVTSIIALMHHEYIGAAAITAQMVNIFEDMVREDECTEILAEEQMPITLVTKP